MLLTTKLLHMSNKTFVINVICLTLTFISIGCKSSHKQHSHKKPSIEVISKPKHNVKNNRVVEEALGWLGTPYKYGGHEKKKGTDCSGMVVRVFEDVKGKKLPRNSKKQAEFCKKIKSKEVTAGDLAFFATGKNKNEISHVGIMIDKNQFIHASTKKGVVISDITSDYYQRTFIMYGRVPE